MDTITDAVQTLRELVQLYGLVLDAIYLSVMSNRTHGRAGPMHTMLLREWETRFPRVLRIFLNHNSYGPADWKQIRIRLEDSSFQEDLFRHLEMFWVLTNEYLKHAPGCPPTWAIGEIASPVTKSSFSVAQLAPLEPNSRNRELAKIFEAIDWLIEQRESLPPYDSSVVLSRAISEGKYICTRGLEVLSWSHPTAELIHVELAITSDPDSRAASRYALHCYVGLVQAFNGGFVCTGSFAIGSDIPTELANISKKWANAQTALHKALCVSSLQFLKKDGCPACIMANALIVALKEQGKQASKDALAIFIIYPLACMNCKLMTFRRCPQKYEQRYSVQ